MGKRRARLDVELDTFVSPYRIPLFETLTHFFVADICEVCEGEKLRVTPEDETSGRVISNKIKKFVL